VVFQFQYSRGVQFCSSLKDKTTQEAFDVIKGLVISVSPVDYGAYYLKNATFAMYLSVLLQGRWKRSEILDLPELHRVQLLPDS
jgi:hypothetical protein